MSRWTWCARCRPSTMAARHGPSARCCRPMRRPRKPGWMARPSRMRCNSWIGRMDENDLKPGDLVRLKSGGPVMVYLGLGSLGDAVCDWFDGAERKRDGFSFASLERAEK